MNTYLAALVGAGFAAAILLGIDGFRRHPDQPARPARRPGRLSSYAATSTGRQRLLVSGVSAGIGLLIGAVTGWWLMVGLLPVAVIGIPIMFGKAPATDIDLLEALDRWIRSVAQSLPIGHDVAGAIRAGLAAAPPLLDPYLTRLVGRLNVGMPADQALGRMADEIADPEADAVVMALVLASRRSGAGLSATLAGLGDNIQDKLRAARAVKVERDRPRQIVRIVTIIGVGLVGYSATTGQFFASYSTPLGQLILAVLLGVYILSVSIMYRMTTPRRRPRILSSPLSRGEGTR